jgi:hypothetical protein
VKNEMGEIPTPVMPALVAGIHDLAAMPEDVDGRDKPGHDDVLGSRNSSALGSREHRLALFHEG